MDASLKILILEDDHMDAEIVQHLLKRQDWTIDSKVAMNKKQFLEALDNFQPDVVLADNSLPQFSATEALEIMNDRAADIPFILVTGTVSEEFAANIIKSGADDYFLKDRLARLPSAIEAALKQRRLEREKKYALQKISDNAEQLRELSQHLQDIREEERASMAREVHDVLGQQLTGFKMDISWLNRHLSNADESIKERITGTLQLIDDAIKTVRRIATDLRPSILDDLGLVPALEWQSEEFEKRSGIKVYFTGTMQELELAPNISIALFRIFQELLTNVARHANATAVKASLETGNGQLQLTVTDNGRGFDIDQGNKKTLGLLGIKERTLLMGGKYEIRSKPGEGTEVIVSVPLVQVKET